MDDLKELRRDLDLVDQKIISSLIERMELVRQIGNWKRENHLKIQDASREREVISNVEHSVEHPIFKEMISNLYTKMMEESRVVQRYFQEIECPFQRVGILGCGLIGGSIIKGLKAKNPNISIGTVRSNAEDAQLALKEGWLDCDYPTLKELVHHSDLIVLASPISTIIPLAKKIKDITSPGQRLIIIDIASIKGEIVPVFEELSEDRIEFLSTHPMAGKETRGFSNSQATLFAGYPWIVVPHRKNSPEVIAAVEQWIRFLGGEVTQLSAEEHDRKTALISHLPGMISKALLEFVSKKDESSLNISGPGFKSMTRLARSNPVMREEIMKSNRKNMEELKEEWISFLKSH